MQCSNTGKIINCIKKNLKGWGEKINERINLNILQNVDNLLLKKKFQKGLKNVFDEAILAALEPPEVPRRRKCIVL